MSDYPDPDEEFELTYGDELDLLKEQDYDEENVNVLPAPTVRKSLDFTTSSKSNSLLKDQASEPNKTSLDNSFDSSFRELQNTVEHNEEDMYMPVISSNSRKRTVDDLFGDINDIFEDDFPENISVAKKPKKDDQLKQDLKLIDLIVQKRKEYKEKNSFTTLSTTSNNILKRSERDMQNLSYSLPKYPFLRVKSFSGQNVYVRFHSESYEKEETQRLVQENTFRGIMGEQFKNAWAEAQELLLKENTINQTSNSEVIEIVNPNTQDKQLWVDLYKPRKYLELLSDESTNRTMLRWMKLWDKVVFNRNPKIKILPKDQGEKKKFFKFNELNTNLDEHGRPEHKVALLCGPPGLGKTTLAHMVAKHAGYNVIEINASDDRSTDAFRTVLENATQMRSVIDQAKRPNCIVFDEIDGAPPASIDFLVKFIAGAATTKGKKSKTKEKGHHILKRPIICICNDVYVPALRPLRQIAFIVNFPQTSTARLAERLMEIARRQQIKTDLGAMMALAEKSNNDIRSCLSVLHFYKAQNKAIGLTDIHKANIGQKDMQKGLFSVWSDIFEIKRSKKVAGGYSMPSIKERMGNILNTISSFGDHERVSQGVYENFPRLNIKDKGLEGTACALDWFCFNDVITKQIYSVQNYSLTSYLNYAFVVWHLVFASSQKQKLNYPSVGYEMRVKETRQKATIAEVLRGMSSSIRCYNAALPLVVDVLPLLLRIISPQFRPVSVHLYTQEERNNLLRIASVMADYNLNYIQERKPDGVYEFKLEPNVEELVIFDNKEDNNRKGISYSNKQLIAREIEMEKMRRLEGHITKQAEQTPRGSTSTSTKAVEKKQNTSNKETPLPNHLQTLRFHALKNNTKSKEVLKAVYLLLMPSEGDKYRFDAPLNQKTRRGFLKGSNKIATKRDFFGRIIQAVESTPGKAVKDPLKNDVWFQYKEGFSNAVKKNIKIRSIKC